MLLDTVEERLFVMMETYEREAGFVLDVIEDAYEERYTVLSERKRALVEQLLDDIVYVWYDEKDLYMFPEDCYEDEFYSEEDARCYPLSESLDDFASTAVWHHPHGDDQEEAFDIHAVYTIDSADNLIYVSWKKDIRHSELWNVFTALVPQVARKDLIRISFADDAQSDTYAYVAQHDEDHLSWEMVVNLAMVYEYDSLLLDEVKQTMIHEFAHILTLRHGQVQLLPSDISDAVYDRAYDACDGYFLQEWCLRDTSYLSAFIEQFWNEDELVSARDYEKPDQYSEEEYVSDYASTNPWEDIAESFTHFVLFKKASWTNERAQKINFFYTYPSLVKLRSRMRSGLQTLLK